MSDEIVTTGPHSVETYHLDEDCPQLDRSNTRPATDDEIEALRLCKYCDPKAIVGGDGSGTGHFESLKAAAEANLGDKEEAGQ